MDYVISVFKGFGAKAYLYDDRIIIEKSLLFGNKEKTIYLSQLAGVIIKKQGATNPAIHFALADSKIKDKSIFNNKDDNTVPFLAGKASKLALEFKADVEAQLSKIYTITDDVKLDKSEADEIAKFKKLLDIGAITENEFSEKKKQLLGL